MKKSKQTKKIKAVLFDLGKVIYHFNFDPAFRRLSRETAVSVSAIEDFFVTSGLEVLYDGGKISSKQFYGQIKKALGIEIGFSRFKKIWNGIFTPNPPVIALIRRLKKKGYPLVLVSNTNAMHYEHLRKNYSVFREFDEHVLSFKEGVRKPDRRIYRIAARACGYPPNQIFYIDDRKDLTEAAGHLGFHTHTYKNDTDQLLKRMNQLGIV